MFCVLVGARLSLGNMPLWLWGIVLLYVIFRSVGKVLGSYYGGKLANSPVTVQKYLGLGIFAQGGVAIGLAIIASEKLSGVRVAENLSMGDMVVFVVTSTTLILQIVGPAMVKFSLKQSGEAGKNITEDDVIATMHVMDVIDDKLVTIEQKAPVAKAVEYFTENDALFYPVLDKDKHICGILTFESLKDIMGDRDSWQWLLVADVMMPVIDSTTPNEPLKNVYDKMVQLKIDQMPVLDNSNSKKVLGMLDIRNIRQKVNAELLRLSN
jgi:CBS domain-containing protein